jgi:hypothetical protein
VTAPDVLYDQVARLEAMRAEHPHAQAWYDRPFWYGAYRVGGWTWVTGRRNDLRNVLDALDRLAEIEVERAAVEDIRPGWRVGVLAPRVWVASRDDICVRGRDALELDAVIGAVEEAVTWPASAG